MIRRPPRSTRTDTLFHYTALFRSRPDLVEPVPDDAPIVPVLRAGDDDDGALRVVSVAPPFRTGAEEIKRRNLAGGCDMGRARTLGVRPWAAGIGAIHRAEGRRVGEEDVSTGIARGAAFHVKQ